MDYVFNGEIAKIYGIPEAVFIHNIYWWIVKNEANGRHYYDGRSWTYNSMKAFIILFPFWTIDQIRRIIERLKNKGVLYIGNYNTKAFDRTQWYALSEDILKIYEKSQMQVADLPNGSGENPTPIPDINTDIYILNNNSKKEIYKKDSNNREKGDTLKIPNGRFIKPTIEEITAYCKERQNDINPTVFFNHYESNGWMVGKTPMKNWKAAIVTWEHRNKETKKPIAQAQGKRNYDEEFD